ncbi:hypothetical protein FA95DRAFT_1605109 [Auriscalpium vulgare]|uniref:Uncharacterized protein n=1 Tax=Auriscalpium vulgare TaxID=40419 RepID=A0ACB8RWK5_9AGAM|nr:hypothetical protein FA95DRAFT_1605109 [Auriscalpium vulgare]
MTAGTRLKGNAPVARPAELRILTQEEYDELSPSQKGNYTKALRKQGIDNELLNTRTRHKAGNKGATDTGADTPSNAARKRAPTTTAIDDSAGKKRKAGSGAPTVPVGGVPDATASSAEDVALGSESESMAIEDGVTNAPVPPPSDEESDSDVEGAQRRALAAKGKRKQTVQSSSEDERGEASEDERGEARQEDQDGEDEEEDEEAEESAQKSFSKSQTAKYANSRPKWKQTGADKALNARRDIPLIVDNYDDDNDDVDVINEARAREAARKVAATPTRQSTPAARQARKPAARPANKRAQAKAKGTSTAAVSIAATTVVSTHPAASSAPAVSNAPTAVVSTHPAASSAPAVSITPTAVSIAPTAVSIAPTAVVSTHPAASSAPAVSNAHPAVVITHPAASSAPAPPPARPAVSIAPTAVVSTHPAASSVHAVSNGPALVANTLHTADVPPAAHALPGAPTIAAAAAPTHADPAGAWPADTELVAPTGKQSHWSIKAQSDRIQKVLHRAIKVDLPQKLFFQNVFPQPQERAAFYRALLVVAAQAEGDVTIASRVQREKEYAAALSKIPEARTSILRGKLKDAADAVVRGAYKIDDFPPERHVRIVKWLVAEEDSLYIFPGDAKESTYDDTQPFGHSAIVMVLRIVFFGPKAIAELPLDLFRCDDGVLRLPPAMVAACATAVEAGLRAFLLGRDAVQVDFTGNQFIRSYLNHIATLQDLKDEAIGVYNALLASLYRAVTSVEGNEAGVAAVGTSNRRVSAARVALAFP